MACRRMGPAHTWSSRLVIMPILLFCLYSVPAQGQTFSSLQAYSGIINMPNARVMPDWQMRFHYGNNDPYRYYGVAMGLWDRLEVHGQFTEVTTLLGFSGNEDYGNYKDRSAGARVVLVPEGEFLPQLAVGFFDATGTALFGSRYLVLSKEWGNIDFSFGLGQGILAGEYIPETVGTTDDRGYSFLFSSVSRPTKPFGGLEWQVAPRLTLAAELSSVKLENMFGYRSYGKQVLKNDDHRTPFDIGIKYQVNKHVSAQLYLMGASDLAGGLNMEFPLDPEGMLPWKKSTLATAGEGERWRAHRTGNEGLSVIIAQGVQDEGFSKVAVSVGESAIWIEAANTVHLSDSRALGHIFRVIESLLPERVQIIYLNLKTNGQVIQSLRASRADLLAYLRSYQDSAGFFAFADLDLYGNEHWHEFQEENSASHLYHVTDNKISYSVKPKIRTFLNNRRGFFKHKGVMRARVDYAPQAQTQIAAELEVPLFNQYDELLYSPLEKDAVRTDLVSYEEKKSSRVTMLAVNHVAQLPYQALGRLSAGIFESAYAGFGAECFRYFNDGLWGIGLEGETVRKRDVDDNFALRQDLDQWFSTSFVNLYAQIWPEQGLEAGLKIGRFLAGDPGVRFELRRSFRYFTLGVWYTKTNTDIFSSTQNRNDVQKGVFISFPFSIFTNRDVKGHLEYDFTSFTRDAGSTVRQPNLLYPMDPWSTPAHVRQTLDEMRGM